MYVCFFIYPHYLKPVEFDFFDESQMILVKKIKNKIENLELSDWGKIKNSDNVLLFIYLYQLSDRKRQKVVMNYLQLPFDPMASKGITKPSSKTLS